MVPTHFLKWVVGTVLIIHTSIAQYNPLKDPNICGKPVCKGGSKFKYRTDVQQVYSYTVDIATLFNGTSKNESTLHVEAAVKLAFISQCEGVLSVYDISLSDNPNAIISENDEFGDNLLHANNDYFSEDISQYTLRFSFQDGIISEICPDEEETNWVLNFKRGILSMIQNTMRRLDLDYITNEEDVHGQCETSYKVKGSKETSLLIEKRKDLNSCQSGSKFHSFLQSTPFRFQAGNNGDSLMKSNSLCKMWIDHNIYNEISCVETHAFQPFSYKAAGAITIVTQKLTLHSEFEAILEEQSSITRRSNLVYDQVPTPKPTSGELKVSRDSLKQLCKLNEKDFQAEFSDVFTQFIHAARLLSYTALSALYGHSGTICTSGKKHMLDALPHLGSSASVALMKDIILNGGVTDDTMYDWMNSIGFISRPNEAMMETASQLLTHKGTDSTVALSITALTHTFCKQNSDCFSNDAVGQIIELLENRILESYKSQLNFEAQENILVSLKGLANIGVVSSEFKHFLLSMIRNNNLDIAIRVTAVQVFRRLPCEPNSKFFVDIFRNETEDVEVRIASYLQIMRCPTYLIIKTIRHSLEMEEVNQVGSFVWSHLQNILKSSDPSKVEVQSLLSDKDLSKKFSSDVRKYSHNYEGSIFFEEYNVGANYESNVIFSPSSYVPRSGNLNLTVDLFGEFVNILELTGRIEGLEHYLESIFGPKGPLNAKKMQDKIPKMRWPRSSSPDKGLLAEVDKMTQSHSKAFGEPKVSLGMKIFGNDLRHKIFKGKDKIMEAIYSLNPVDYMKKLVSGKEINYNKAAMFMDSNYLVPTGSGFPIVLNAVGTVAVNLKLFGALHAADFMKTKALDVIGDIKPNAAVDIVGTMSVDAYYASTAIKLKTNVHTSTAIEGNIKIRGTDLISVTFSLPNEKSEIFGAQSELVVVKGEIEQVQSGVENTAVSRSTCSSSVIEKALGLKLCAHYHYSDVTNIETAPYFPLAGRSGFGLSLQKAAQSYILQYAWDKSSGNNVMSFTFDTPGTIERRLMSANITFQPLGCNANLAINSPGYTITAQGSYRNTQDEKHLQVTLNINDKKHFDASLSLKQIESQNGYTYAPKAYLGVNGERVAEIQGTLKWMTKKSISQCDVDITFHTKRLTSKLFGYVSKTDASIGTNLKFNYKFANTKEQRALIEVLLANRSTRTLMALLGDIKLETTAYPHFNFEGTLKFQRAAGKLESKLEINSGAYSREIIKDDPNRLKVVIEVKHRTTSGGYNFVSKIIALKPATDLDVGVEFLYVVMGPNTDLKALIKYSKEKQALINVYWSHPRGTLERYQGLLNVTIPSYSPMAIQLKVNERRPSNYDIDLDVSWFSGHSVNIRGIYQNRGTITALNHHLKVIMKSPSFENIEADGQFYQDDIEFRLDIKAIQGNNNYALFYKHIVPSSLEISTQAKIKYNTQVYSINSLVNLKNRKQVLLEFHLDRIRDIHLELWTDNKEFHKSAGFDLKWDANRDPNQKLIATVEFKNLESYNYAANLVISYPGRTINGIIDFYMKDGRFFARTHLAWSPTHILSFTISTEITYTDETLFLINSQLITPVEDWKKISLQTGYNHKGNMYRLNGSMDWNENQRVSLNIFRDYETTTTAIRYEFSSAILSTVPDLPSITLSLKHNQDVAKVDTHFLIMLNPKKVFAVKSSWHIDENKDMKNLTGTVSLVSPFAGYNKGLLVSKIYVTNKKYLRGVADLDLDHRKYTASVEGHYHKFTDNMFVFNITTTNEKFKKITGEFGFLEDQRHLIALIQYPSGTTGFEVKLQMESLENFDVKVYLATPIEFLETVLILGKLKPEEADFRLGWNLLLVGFTGVWHYTSITDCKYSYMIYTPIEGFKQNGVVAKLLLTDGLDFEASVKLGEKRVGASIFAQPKPKILKDFGIKSQAIYNQNFRDGSDEDYEEVENPINWNGFVEVDTILYSTVKCSFDIDQIGNLYVLLGTVTLPDGLVEFKNEFDFNDVLNINNKLSITTPYVACKEVSFMADVDIVIGYQISFGIELDYQAKNDFVSMGTSVLYFVEEDEDSSYRNITFHLHAPFLQFSKLDVRSSFARNVDDYVFSIFTNTNSSDAALDTRATLNSDKWDINGIFHITAPIAVIPKTKIDFKKIFSEQENKVEVTFDMKTSTPTKAYFLTVWKFNSITDFRGKLLLSTPIKGMEKTEVETFFSLANKQGKGKLQVLLHPINFGGNVTIRNNQLHSTIISEFNRERRLVVIQAQLSDFNEIEGIIKMNNKEYQVTGSLEPSEDNWPKRILIQIKSEESGIPFHIQYHANRNSVNDFLFTLRVSQGTTYLNLQTSIKSEIQDQYNIHIEITTSNARYAAFVVDAQIGFTEDTKSLILNTRTPFEYLENGGFSIKYRNLGIKRNVQVTYQFSDTTGNIEGEYCWLLMENMQLKLVNNYQTLNSTERSVFEVYYVNPAPSLTNLRLGGYGEMNEIWKISSNASVSIITTDDPNFNLKANILLPSSKEHNIVGKFSSAKNWTNLNYLLNYTSSKANRIYGSSGKVDFSKEDHVIGNLNVEWNRNRVENWLDWEHVNDIIDLHYKLRSPKYENEYTVVTDVKLYHLQPYKNISCHIYYPASRNVMKAKVDFREFANMDGTVDLITPFKKFEFLNSKFKTETSGIVYNRFVEASWPNNTAFLDAKRITVLGVSALDRDTTGTLFVEIPLTTRHVGHIDYKYSEKPNVCIGSATVNYNGERILNGKYNRQSESRAGFEKDTIRVEAENKFSPIGVTYIHGYKYSVPNTDDNIINVDSKHLEVYDLHNRTGFNLTGEMELQSKLTGKEISITAIHSNRTVKLWSNYDVLGQQFKQHSKVELAPSVWVSYDFNVLNRTEDESADSQQIEINLSYPGRNFTSLSSYKITNDEVVSELSMVWDGRKRIIETILDWKRDPSPHFSRQQVELQIKHPTLEKNITFLAEYQRANEKLLDLRFTADYSTDLDQKLELTFLLEDKSDNVASNYNYSIYGTHPATKLHLDAHGDIFWKYKWYSTKHLMDYKRTYLPLQSREAFVKIDIINKEIEFKKKSLRELSYLWGKYIPHYPLYTANLSAIHGKDINATGQFYLNFKQKLIKLELNITEDGSRRAHMYGAIPDARNTVFDIWRIYDDTRVSDISYYLRLNHSRLIVSNFKWRPEIKSDIQDSIRVLSVGLYNDFVDNLDYWKQYIYSETSDAILDVWQDAKPQIQNFLNDLEDLATVEEDVKKLNEYLQGAYEANEFYIRDIINYLAVFVDEVSIRSHIESVPKILNEIWEVMGDSRVEIQKRILWTIEKIKTYYNHTVQFINGLIQGNALEYLTDAFSKLLEHYDNLMKDLHVSFIRYMEHLWKQTYTMLLNNWYKMLAALEPTFIKLLHYLETVVWNASNELLEFLQIRKTEIMESPYFGKFASMTHDLDKLYKDLSGNSTISNIYKYSTLIWTFVNEKYIKLIPFSNELQEVITEINTELKGLKSMPYVDYLNEKYNEMHENFVWIVRYFDIEHKIEKFIGLIYYKLTDLRQTALETENRYRTAKTKFIFEPSEGVIYLEQKLPVSWHAFNETPKFQEIPEYKAINDLQNYFISSNTNFWNLYYDYKPYTDPTDWFPPFKAQAMLAGLQYYVTFDRQYYNFHGSCAYLLASDFIDGNFSVSMSYDATTRNHNELMVFVNSTIIKIDVQNDVVKVGDATISRLPIQIGDLFLYQEFGVVTLDSAAGFVLQCNMKFDVCILELSGWYFGKTAGLWGTMNNEPSDDLLPLSGEQVKRNDIDSFVQSWALDRTCSPLGRQIKEKQSPSEDVKTLCDVFFRSKVSPFVACFPRVSNIPFFNMCLNSFSESEACTAAVAYMNLCAVENTPLRIPEACVKCNLPNGTTVPEGEFIRFEGDDVPRSTDVVFIVEAKECNKDLKSKRNIDTLVDLIEKELFEMNITHNRYSVITFGGNGVFDLPRSIVVNGNYFSGSLSIKSYFKNIPVGNGSSDIFAAIVFATKLVFQPAVSKTFILLPCSDCHESSMKLDYAILHQLLIENDITLHILMNEEFEFQKSRVNKIFFGMDKKYAFTKNDVRELKGDRDLLGQVRKPKATLGVCMSFARDTNGSIFTAKKLEADKKNAIKRFATVFAKRVASSALPKKCQICECTAPNTGLSYMECFPCHYPVFASINNGFNEDEALAVMQPIDEEDFDYSEE